MTPRALRVLNLALELGREDRAALAARLLACLEDDGEEVDPRDWDRAWGAEIDRRLREIDSGAVSSIPHEEVEARARAIVEGAKGNP